MGHLPFLLHRNRSTHQVELGIGCTAAWVILIAAIGSRNYDRTYFIVKN